MDKTPKEGEMYYHDMLLEMLQILHPLFVTLFFITVLSSVIRSLCARYSTVTWEWLVSASIYGSGTFLLLPLGCSSGCLLGHTCTGVHSLEIYCTEKGRVKEFRVIETKGEQLVCSSWLSSNLERLAKRSETLAGATLWHF